jgi:hypothetical protein
MPQEIRELAAQAWSSLDFSGALCGYAGVKGKGQ